MTHVVGQLRLSNLSSRQDIVEMIAKSWLQSYNNVQSLDLPILKQALAFLVHCDLIMATPVVSDFNTRINVRYKLEKENGFKTKQEVLSQVSYKIKYPVLYIVILKETLRSSYKVQM